MDVFRALTRDVGHKGGVRLTFVCPKDRPRAGSVDPVQLCARIRLRLLSYATHTAPGGAEMVIVQTERDDATAEIFIRMLTDAGYVLIQARRGGRAKAG